MIKKEFLNFYIFILFNTLILSLFNLSVQSLKFNIPNNREKCFNEDIFTNGTLLIRYDLKGVEFIKKESQEKVLQNIKLANMQITKRTKSLK